MRNVIGPGWMLEIVSIPADSFRLTYPIEINRFSGIQSLPEMADNTAFGWY